VDNALVARAFDELADLLELAGENPFKLRAYRTFAATARGLEEPLALIARRRGLGEIQGVGKAIAGKVAELIEKGTFAALEKARAAVPPTLPQLLRVQGLGPKSVRVLWKEGGITTLGELAYACEENRLAQLPGFGKKKQAKTLQSVTRLLEAKGSILLALARDAASLLTVVLRDAGATDAALVSQARRGVELVDGIDVIACDLDAPAIAAALETTPFAEEVEINDGLVYATLEAVRARVRPVSRGEWVEALLLGTGDDEHVAWLGQCAEEKGGIASVCRAAKNEEEVYRALGLAYVPPELREGASPRVPDALLQENAVGGVFHVHTDWSDGTATLEQMAGAAASAGLTYVGISDHSQAASYANGLDAARLAEQTESVRAAREKYPELSILHGIEVDILADGSLDLDDAALAELDFVIASVHSRLAMEPQEMTARIVRAVSHPLVTMLGHPTGRLLLGRRGGSFDVAEVAKAAAANDTYLEINANPHRLDLSAELVRRAAAFGARFCINPDAHSPRGFLDTKLGVVVARRAGLERTQVLNTLAREEIVRVLEERKERATKRLGR
jgi:DNA polymerase (family 10)